MRACVLLLAAFAVACGSAGATDGDAAKRANDGAPPAAGGPGPGPSVPVGASAKLDCDGHGCAVRQLALGIIAGCALLEDKTVACYGGGIVGTLGRADRPEIDPIPQRVPKLGNVARIFAGGYSMCALLEDTTVTCWGPDQSANPYGARPGDLFAVEGLADVVDLAVSTSHTCALVASGDVHCFGSNYFGELGDGTIANSRKPVKVAAIRGARKIATGGEVSCAVLEGGSVSCWGTNDQGQLGQGTSDKLIHPDPVVVGGLGGPARSIAASSVTGAVCALLEDGSAKCWGEKLAGAPARGGAEITVGGGHACVLEGAGGVSCWGANTKGQLGGGSNAAAMAATAASGIKGALGLSAGGSSSCAVFGDGSFACWGDDSRGQLGSGKIGAIRTSPEQKHF